MADLTVKQRMFIAEYMVDFNATQAAIRAGYSEATAKQMGAENLSKPAIKAEIEKRVAERSDKIEVTQAYVIETIVNVIERCSQGVEVMIKDGDNWVRSGEWKFDAGAVLKGAELLGKHKAMFTDKVVGAGENGEHTFREVDKAPVLSKDEWLIAHGIKPAK